MTRADVHVQRRVISRVCGRAAVYALACSGCVLGLLATPAPVQGAPDPACAALDREIDALVLATRDPRVLERLAPYISVNVVPKVIARVPKEPPPLAFELLLTAGRSGHAEALRLVRQVTPRQNLEVQVGRSLALLALGEGSETGTIAGALETAPASLRLEIVHALARMKHPRPRELLRGALDDPQPEVRLAAAEGLVRVRSMMGRRVLLDLSRTAPEPLKARAAKVLGSSRWASAHLDAIPRDLVGRAEAKLAARGRRDVTRRARGLLISTEAAQRTGAFAALAVSREETPESLERLARRAASKNGPEVDAELAMAQVLMGDEGAIEKLEALDATLAPNAIAVLWNAAGASDPEAPLTGPAITRLFRLLERWTVSGVLGDRDAARAIDAAAALGQRAARPLARARLLGPDGRALVAAVRALSRAGAIEDVRALIDLSRRKISEETRVEAYRAADRLCGGR